MRRTRAAQGLALAIALAATAQADPPQVNQVSPAGAQRSVPTDLTVNGANLDANPRWISPFPVAIEPLAEPGDASNWKLKVTIPTEVPLGVYPVRIQTDEGISNPFLLAVDQFPSVAEVEPNNSREEAQAVSIPAVIEGQAAGNDVDFFKFKGRQGQRILFDALCARIGSGIDPQIRLTTASGQFVASEDDSPGLLTDARMTAELPEDGEYIVELSDSKYQGANPPAYRLRIAEVLAPMEVYPLGGRRSETVGFELRGGTVPGDGPLVAASRVEAPAPFEEFRPRFSSHALGLAGPTDPALEADLIGPLEVSDLPELRESSDPNAPTLRAAPPVVLNGRIDPPGQEDRFNLVVSPGQKLRIRVHAADLGSSLDGTLRILNPADGSQLAIADDTQIQPIREKGQNRKPAGQISPDPTLEFVVPEGLTEITLALRDIANRGGVGYPYRIRVELAEPGFSVELTDAQVNIPKGGTAAVPVSIIRQDYNGPIHLSVANLPPGLTVRGGQIADGQEVGLLSLSASADANFEQPPVLEILGNGQGPSGPIVERAAKQVIFAQQATLPLNVQTQLGLPAATTSASIITLEAPEGSIEAVHGYSATIPVQLNRVEGADAAVAITPLPLPPGLGVAEVQVLEKAVEADVVVTVDPSAAIGQVAIGLAAKGKLADKDQTFEAPAVILDVVRPASVELAATELEVKAGQTIELKGKVIRRGPFQEAVQVQVNGLPEGLKAEPIDLAADASEFTIPIIAGAEATEAEAAVQVALAFQVAGNDYETPPTPMALKVVK